MDQLVLFPDLSGDATFSPCRQYRYLLWRRWAKDWESNYAMFIGLNPSTATETIDDPTVRRCIQFAKDWGYSALLMTNLFGYCATDPKKMIAIPEPIGPENDRYLQEYAAKASVVVAAWGNHGDHLSRHEQVKQMLPNLHYLKLTKTGMPGHPLYLLKTLNPIPFQKPQGF